MSEMPEDVKRAAFAAFAAFMRDPRTPLNVKMTLVEPDAFLDPVEAAIVAERERCVSICQGWLDNFGKLGAELKFTSPRDYANGAVEDISQLIREGVAPTI